MSCAPATPALVSIIQQTRAEGAGARVCEVMTHQSPPMCRKSPLLRLPASSNSASAPPPPDHIISAHSPGKRLDRHVDLKKGQREEEGEGGRETGRVVSSTPTSISCHASEPTSISCHASEPTSISCHASELALQSILENKITVYVQVRIWPTPSILGYRSALLLFHSLF